MEKTPRCAPRRGSSVANSLADSGAEAPLGPRTVRGCGFHTRSVCLAIGHSNLSRGLYPSLAAVSSFFSELIELGTSLSRAVPPPARGCLRYQEAQAARSGPARARGAPKFFWGPACQFLPSAKYSPRARLGGVWAVGPAWDICSRQSRIKGEGLGGGAQNQPLDPKRMPVLSAAGGGSQGQRTRRVLCLPLGKERIGVGSSPCLPLSRSPVRCHPRPRCCRTTGYPGPAGAARALPEAPARGIR